MKQILCDKAKEARNNAYAPYSQFRVGAALLCRDGSIYTGCNVESASYSPTCCAERTAFFKAVSEGKRDFSAIAVCGGKGDGLSETFCFPCGVCRQVMSEFCGGDFIIYVMSEDGVREYTLSELLPHGFGLDITEA